MPPIITFIFTAHIGVAYAFGIYLFSSLAPFMLRDWQIDYADIALISALIQIGFLLGCVLAPYLCRYFGAIKTVLNASLATCILLATLAIANYYASILIFPLLGALTSITWISIAAITGGMADFNKRSKILAIIASGTNFGLIISGISAPLIIHYYGWRMVWGFTALVAMIIFLISYQTLSRKGLIKKENYLQKNPINKQNYLMHNLLIWGIMFLSGFVGRSFITYIPLVAAELPSMPLRAGNYIWITIAMPGLASGFIAGIIADKIGIRQTLAAMFALNIIAAGLIIASTAISPSVAKVFIAAFIFGIGFNVIFGLIPAYISKTRTPQQSINIFAIGNMILAAGGSLGNYLGGIWRYTQDSFLPLYVTIAILAALIIILIFLLPKEIKDK